MPRDRPGCRAALPPVRRAGIRPGLPTAAPRRLSRSPPPHHSRSRPEPWGARPTAGRSRRGRHPIEPRPTRSRATDPGCIRFRPAGRPARTAAGRCLLQPDPRRPRGRPPSRKRGRQESPARLLVCRGAGDGMEGAVPTAAERRPAAPRIARSPREAAPWRHMLSPARARRHRRVRTSAAGPRPRPPIRGARAGRAATRPTGPPSWGEPPGRPARRAPSPPRKTTGAPLGSGALEPPHRACGRRSRRRRRATAVPAASSPRPTRPGQGSPMPTLQTATNDPSRPARIEVPRRLYPKSDGRRSAGTSAADGRVSSPPRRPSRPVPNPSRGRSSPMGSHRGRSGRQRPSSGRWDDAGRGSR